MKYENPIGAFEGYSSDPVLPCRNLCLAIIDRALRDLQQQPDTGAEHREHFETLEWFDSDSEEPWSFNWCAGYVGEDFPRVFREACKKEGINAIAARLQNIDLGRKRIDYSTMERAKQERTEERRTKYRSSGEGTKKDERKDVWASWDNFFEY